MTGNQVQKLRKDIWKVLQTALDAADPVEAIRRNLTRDEETLEVGNRQFDLSRVRRIAIVGSGKASAKMAYAVARILRGLEYDGVISVRDLPEAEPTAIRVIKSGHPVPDENSRRAAIAALEMVKPLLKDDLVICLISGGASALWVAPAEGLTLLDKAATTKALFGSGADIHEMNTVRKHLSAIKGGWLAKAVHPATLITLAVSDVVGDDPGSIGSGPTVADESTFADAIQVVEKYRLENSLPESVLTRLRRGRAGEIAETPKPGEDFLTGNPYQIIASNRQALKAAEERAKELGYSVILAEESLIGEARLIGAELARRGIEAFRNSDSLTMPLMLISGGETTVKLLGSGKGGRNQELALAAALELSGHDNIVLASFGTDGSDGPTDAAGAIVDGATIERANKAGINARQYLENNDSYNFFEPLGDLLRTGPTGTNVMDIQVVAVGKK